MLEKYSNKISSVKKANHSIIQILFGTLGGLLFSLIAIIIIAVILYFNPMVEKSMGLISQIIKYISAVLAAMVACINKSTKGYLRGLSACLLYLFVGQVLFGLFGGGIVFNKLFLLDLLTFSTIGVITGAIAVNIKSKAK